MKTADFPLHVKRVYAEPLATDGCRILVDRLWPRGLSKEKAEVAIWLKDIAPSSELRRWYGHDPDKWAAFKERYAKELGTQPEQLAQILDKLAVGAVTLLYGSKEERLNNAVALQEYLGTIIKQTR